MSDKPMFHNVQLDTHPHTGAVKSITLQLSYGPTEAEATILLRPDQSLPATDDNVRQEILQLADALRAAAQSPLGVSSRPQARS